MELDDADSALIQAFNLGMGEGEGWSDEVMDEAERLLPTLVAAGYAAVDDEAHTWWFTPDGVNRRAELERLGFS